MNTAFATRHIGSGMLAPLLALATGGMVVAAIGLLDRFQAEAFEHTRIQVRNFRQARLELASSVLHLGWSARAGNPEPVAGEAADVQRGLAQVEKSLADWGGDSDGMAGAVLAQVAEFRRLMPRDQAPDAAGAAALKRGFQALESAMDRLDGYNAGQVRQLLERQRLQFDIGVGVALSLLLLLGILVLRNHRRLQHAESAVRADENNLRQMVELLPAMVWGCDVQGNCDFLSARWVHYTGVPMERQLGMGWLEQLHPDDRERVAMDWDAKRRSRTDLQWEFRIRRRDGVYRWFDTRAGRVLDEQGETVRWFGACSDITDRKLIEAELVQHRDRLEEQVRQRTTALTAALEEHTQAERRLQQLNVQLRDAETFVRQVADSIPGRVAYWDRETRCRFVNRGYGDWFGFERSEILGRSLVELHGPAYFERIQQRVHAALAGEAQDFERDEVSSSGERAVTRVQYLPDLREGQVHGFFVLATNITRLKQAEQLLQLGNAELAEARDRANAANRAKSVFLANMSHEIRTPMNAIIGLTHMLRRDVTDPQHQVRLSKVWNAAHHLLQVINDILDLSKIEAGKLVLDKVDFSLDAVLTRTCSMVLEAAREKGLEMVLDTGHVPDRLNGDPTRLMQALLNLLGNAVKFTERGSVLLKGELLQQDGSGLLIRFEVRDTGIGIAPEAVPLLFTPFEQGDDSSTRRHGGTGLGLTITRHIAELMGGGAGGESTPGLGSRFWITVRMAPALQPEPASAPSLGGLRSLVVDDLPEAREAMADMLRTLGLRAEVAASGEEALRMAEDAQAAADPYAVLLLDAAMPGMDGLQTAARLREVLTQAPQMALVSAHDGESLQQTARANGFGTALLKPVTPSLLLDCLMRLLRHVGPASTVAVEAGITDEQVRERHRGARVLLAEDNPVNQEVAAELLQSAGLVVDIAADGEQAVRMARGGGYALVLMDVQMPHMDGLQATRQLRQDPALAGLPIVAMTANAFSEDRQDCLDAGMNDHLVKPVDPQILHAALLRWLPKQLPVVQSPPQSPPVPTAAKSAAQRLAGITRLDLSVVYTQCADKPELAVRVLKQFVAHYRNAGAALVDHLQAGEFEQQRRKLHSMRGATSAVGAMRVLQHVHVLENLLRAQAPVEELMPPAHALRAELDALIEELAQQLEN